MSSGITPTGGSSPYYRPAEQAGDQTILAQMEEFQKELREDMGPPPQVGKLEQLLEKMQTFLKDNQAAIYQMLEHNGFHVKGSFGIAAEFQTAIDCIQQYLKNPENSSLELLNESITQLNFYLHHRNPEL